MMETQKLNLNKQRTSFDSAVKLHWYYQILFKISSKLLIMIK